MSSHKLSLLEKIGYGSGDMAVNVVISSMMLIITFFYTDVFGLDPVDVGYLLLSVRLIDAITDPLMGIITDKYTTRWGRYRPYFLIMAIPFGISVFLTFSTPDLDYNSKLVWAYATYIFVTIMFTMVTIPYISIIGVMTDNPKEKLSANGYRLFFAKIAALLVTMVVPVLAESWGGEDLASGYQFAMGLMAILGALLFIFCFFTTKERIEHKVETKPFISQIKLLVKNDQWLILCAICVVGTIGYVIRGSVALYYAKYYLGADATMSSAFLSTGVAAAIIAMVASTWITKHYCKIKLFRYSQLFVGLLSVMMYFFVAPGDIMLAFILYFALSFIVDLHAPVFWSIISEAIDYGTVKTGERVSGLAYGGISFSQKAGMGLAGFIVGMLLTYFNYQADQEQSASTLTGIALMLSIIPGVFHAIMGLLMFKYKINNEKYEEIKQKLAVSANSINEQNTPEINAKGSTPSATV